MHDKDMITPAATHDPRVFVEREPTQDEIELANKIVDRITSDKAHFAKVFENMHEASYIARNGAPREYPKDQYRANFIGRHIKSREAELYSKDPKISARIVRRIDYKVWDENPMTLQKAFQDMQSEFLVGQDGQPILDETGNPVRNPNYERAMAIVEDFKRVNQMQTALQRIGRSLELSLEHYLRVRQPLNFKDSMKAVVRRALTTNVGYVMIGYRKNGIDDVTVSQDVTDITRRMSSIASLALDDRKDMNAYEAEQAYRGLVSQEKGHILNEGLEFTYPDSHRVIPDKNCRSLKGFVRARWLTVEHPYTESQLRATFGRTLRENASALGDDDSHSRSDTILVWEHYDRLTGMVYKVCDGVDGFLDEPAPPPFEVEGFFPIVALTFNDIEDPDNPFSPSDVELMLPMQDHHNKARQGQIDHRDYAKPKTVVGRSALTDDAKDALANMAPFQTIEINLPPGQKISDILQPVATPGVDPNLYQTAEFYRDMSLAGGTSEAAMGGAGRSTATEAELAASSQRTSNGSNVDDLDSCLSAVANMSSDVLLQMQTKEKTIEIVGEGAVWADVNDIELISRIRLDVAAGSSGKPNQAAEIANWMKMLPLITQLPNVDPLALAKVVFRVLDADIDLNELIVPGMMSIMQQNSAGAQQPQMPTGNPMTDPAAQGPQGANTAPRSGGQPGTAFPTGVIP